MENDTATVQALKDIANRLEVTNAILLDLRDESFHRIACNLYAIVTEISQIPADGE